MVGETVIDLSQDAEEVVLESLDGSFSHVGVVDIRQDKLVHGVPVLGDDTMICLVGFIVECLMLHAVAEVGHDASMSGNVKAIMARLEGLN